MIIEKTNGTHSEKDQIIMVTTASQEKILLDDVFNLVYEFGVNELHRIRADPVRADIIRGDRPFYFEELLIKALKKAKDDVLQTTLLPKPL